MALQGVEVEIHDLDIQTDKTGADEIERCFPEYGVTPVRYSESDRIWSYFCRLEINGVRVEIPEDIQKHLDDAWGARAGGSVRSAGLADGLQPAGCGASGSLSRLWSTAGLPRHDSTPADFTTRACARGGCGMSHQQGVGPGRLREGSALTPCPSWPRNTQGSSAGLERTLSSPPHRLSDALSSDRRVLSRI